MDFVLSLGCTLVQLAFAAVQHGGDNLIHVVILILTQASAEDDLRLGVGQLLVLGVERAVLLVVHRVVGFIAGLPLGAVLAADDGLGLGAELKVLVLDDAGVGRLGVGVVDDGVALIVVGVQRLGLKADVVGSPRKT